MCLDIIAIQAEISQNDFCMNGNNISLNQLELKDLSKKLYVKQSQQRY